jgi:hypothetical protein
VAEPTILDQLVKSNPANDHPTTPIASGLAWLGAAAELADVYLDGCTVHLRARTGKRVRSFAIDLLRNGNVLWSYQGIDAKEVAFRFVAEASTGVWS